MPTTAPRVPNTIVRMSCWLMLDEPAGEAVGIEFDVDVGTTTDDLEGGGVPVAARWGVKGVSAHPWGPGRELD